ncbi:luciferase [Martensiomyces pterosporus]|nr:luciferase [Martensiomyces pterosporus]
MTISIIKSPFPDVDIPSADLPTYFFEQMRQFEEFTRKDSPRPLFVDGTKGSTKSLTLDQLETMANRLASGLYNVLGVRQGDVVAVVMPNSIYYPAILLAVLMVGATCTLANPAYIARELNYQLAHSSAKFIIAASSLIPTVKEATAAAELLLDQHVLVADHTTGQSEEPVVLRSIFDVLSDADYPRVRLTSHESVSQTVAIIPYSSGTTGLPKGVKLSHYNFVSNIQQSVAIQRLYTSTYPRVCVAILPMFHIYGLLFLCFVPAIAGSSTVVMPKFDMAQFLTLVQTHQITEAMLVPPIINALVKQNAAKEYDLSSLSWITCGAAPLNTDTVRSLERMFDGIRLMQGYGLTEASPAIALSHPDSKNPSSCGKLVPNIEAMVIDDLGRALGTDEVGELCFRGPNVMTGYLNNDQATRETIDSDGFLHTGDIGYIDEDGYVYVTDRKKELIKFNGFQVAPAELEGILMQHPRVRDCAVFGVYDKSRQTEVPKAHLVLTADDKLDIQEPDDVAHRVVEWMNEQVAYYKHLRGGYVVVDAIPKSASGKILRRFLK